MIAAACSFQACQSPEQRVANGDSTGTSAAADSGKSDTGAVSSASKDSSDKDNMPKDVTNQSKVDEDEAVFMKTAAVGGMMEVDLGKLAQKSANAKVKAFAAQMVADHSKANAELKAIAASSGIILPSVYPAAEQAHVDMMKKMTGAAFDKHYVEMMVTDHDKTVALFKGAASGSKTKEVKDFAAKTLPVIEGHFAKAKALQGEMK